MGNSVVTTLKIAVEKDPVNPAFHSAPTKKLRGTVFLYVAWKTEYEQLQLRLLGHEHTHVDPTQGVKKKYSKRKTKVVINTAVTLRPAGTFEVGKYEFPFEMDIPSGLPTTVCGGWIGSNVKKVNPYPSATYPNSWYYGYMLEARLSRQLQFTHFTVMAYKTIRLYN